MKWLVATPTVKLKVPVKRKNVASLCFTGQVDQADVGEINAEIAILFEDVVNIGGSAGKLKRNLEHTADYVLEYSLRRARQLP